MKKQTIRAERGGDMAKVYLFNTGETVDVSGGAAIVGVRADENLILTFEEAFSKNQKTYFHLLRKGEDEVYDYYALDMDFTALGNGAICHRTLYGTAETGRLPFIDFNPGLGEVKVSFCPDKISIKEVLTRPGLIGGQAEFWTAGHDIRGEIRSCNLVYQNQQLDLQLEPFEIRDHLDEMEPCTNGWYREEGYTYGYFKTSSIREAPGGKVIIGAAPRFVTITFKQE